MESLTSKKKKLVLFCFIISVEAYDWAIQENLFA